MKLPLIILLLSLFSFTHTRCQSGAQAPELKFKDTQITWFYDVDKNYQRVVNQLKKDDLPSGEKNKLEKQLQELKHTKKAAHSDFESAVNEAGKQVKAANGEFTFRFNNQWYDGIIVDPKKQRVRMHWLTADQTPHRTLESVRKELEANGNRVLMLTNGGMYLEDNRPQGLFIAEGKELRPIVLDSNKYGNFYMKPNGVFYIDDSGGHVVTSEAFAEKKPECAYATQSGPMLTINGKINPKFNHRSTSFYSRSGVGILPDGRIVFIISRADQTNFHDFASIFTDAFGCRDALYLDGAISRMYLAQSRKHE